MKAKEFGRGKGCVLEGGSVERRKGRGMRREG